MADGDVIEVEVLEPTPNQPDFLVLLKAQSGLAYKWAQVNWPGDVNHRNRPRPKTGSRWMATLGTFKKDKVVISAKEVTAPYNIQTIQTSSSGQAVLVIDGGYFYSISRKPPGVHHADSVVAALTEVVAFLEGRFQRQVVGFWIDGSLKGYQDYIIETIHNLADREVELQRASERHNKLNQAMNGVSGTLPRITYVEAGKMKRQSGNGDGIGHSAVWVQSGVDTAVVCKLIEVYLEKKYQPVILCAGDGDLAPALDTCQTLKRVLQIDHNVRLLTVGWSVSGEFGKNNRLGFDAALKLDEDLPHRFPTPKATVPIPKPSSNPTEPPKQRLPRAFVDLLETIPVLSIIGSGHFPVPQLPCLAPLIAFYVPNGWRFSGFADQAEGEAASAAVRQGPAYAGHNVSLAPALFRVGYAVVVPILGAPRFDPYLLKSTRKYTIYQKVLYLVPKLAELRAIEAELRQLEPSLGDFKVSVFLCHNGILCCRQWLKPEFPPSTHDSTSSTSSTAVDAPDAPDSTNDSVEEPVNDADCAGTVATEILFHNTPTLNVNNFLNNDASDFFDFVAAREDKYKGYLTADGQQREAIVSQAIQDFCSSLKGLDL
eukprot:GGOE01008431.1.p1 GENE.GGOE01008431.1~~GGOE01008431.1.p1  ORF type:complete len:606 (-),score=134.32 GGOE01008431.1:511-2307(-)